MSDKIKVIKRFRGARRSDLEREMYSWQVKNSELLKDIDYNYQIHGTGTSGMIYLTLEIYQKITDKTEKISPYIK